MDARLRPRATAWQANRHESKMRQQARDRVSFKRQRRSILPASPPQDGFALANLRQRPRIRGTPKKPGAESAIHFRYQFETVYTARRNRFESEPLIARISLIRERTSARE